MAKSKHIGVRFDQEKLEAIKSFYNVKTHQQVLNLLMDDFTDSNIIDLEKKEDTVLENNVDKKLYTINDMPKGLSFFEKKKWKSSHGL